ncbi:phage tail protein [Pseudomonas putida]|uniref:phage tail tube protein n=1 Tax=Pseudomonas sp. NBRC 111141 TaxID=1661056 RepID=UPI0008637696|nr:phage tail tube protein [Pseudomonas sp. NBRC 111141]EKT4484029.1 phage tail protein [Pseudomonas putida]EKT4502711.1 phage tail protein [Pseudomonas putida]
MSMNAQGAQLYALLPPVSGAGPKTVMEVECLTAFNPGGAPADQIDDTCLADTDRKYKKGLRTPGQATATILADPRNASHVRMFQLSQDDSDEDILWALGWSDGKGIAPTVNTEGDDFELPSTRTWCLFAGYVADFPFDFASNASVSTAATIQRSGKLSWIIKENP